MEIQHLEEPQEITIRPATVFAFIQVTIFLLASIALLLLAWRFWPGLIWFSLLTAGMGFYRFLFIRKIRYVITPETISISTGIFFKRTDYVELYRVKDYILTRPFLLQICGLMNLTLKSTDSENPIVWLRGFPVTDLVDTLRAYVQAARMSNKIIEIN